MAGIGGAPRPRGAGSARPSNYSFSPTNRLMRRPELMLGRRRATREIGDNLRLEPACFRGSSPTAGTSPSAWRRVNGSRTGTRCEPRRVTDGKPGCSARMPANFGRHRPPLSQLNGESRDESRVRRSRVINQLTGAGTGVQFAISRPACRAAKQCGRRSSPDAACVAKELGQRYRPFSPSRSTPATNLWCGGDRRESPTQAAGAFQAGSLTQGSGVMQAKLHAGVSWSARWIISSLRWPRTTTASTGRGARGEGTEAGHF